MTYGYARVSTKSQAKHGNSLEQQIQLLRQAGCQTIREESFTGATTERPIWNALCTALQEGDTLMVTKLDRFARSASEGYQQIQDLLDRGIHVRILNMGEINDTPQGRLMLQILLAFAEFERDLILERCQEGKAIARQRKDYHEGRPPLPLARKQHAACLVLDEHHSYNQVTKETGLSRSTVARAVRAEKLRRLGVQS